MEILRTLIALCMLLAGVCFVVGLAYMAGMISTVYRVTPGGWLNGAQTFLLFAISLYCYGRAIRW
ncbi:MAG: hypothetical protein HY215_02430 [Candidatus Rokubacteria bacterium]|nr:hypothetical protein [Candidatus Rokubacteria bacterium]